MNAAPNSAKSHVIFPDFQHMCCSSPRFTLCHSWKAYFRAATKYELMQFSTFTRIETLDDAASKEQFTMQFLPNTANKKPISLMNKKYNPSNDSSFTFDLEPKLFHVYARSPQKTKKTIRSRPPLFRRSLFAFLLATVFLVPLPAFGQAAIEGGALFSSAFELSDGKRANAAEGWKLGVLPTVRAEYWWKKDNPWKFGVVALPFYFRTNQRLTNDLTVEGKNFNAGQNIKLQYQFHNIRGTAAYRLVNKPKSEFRLGASVIVRYANIKITDQTKSVSGTNLIAFPLLFLESRTRLTDTSSLVVRGDTFPTKDIRQGLYDFLVAIEKSSQQAKSRSFSVGVRAFWGGFSPRKVGDNNNEVFFIGPVLRVQF